MNRALIPLLAMLGLAGTAGAPISAHAAQFVVTSCGESPTRETAGWTLTPSTATLETGTQCPPVLDQPGAPIGNRSQHTGLYLNDRLGAPSDTPAGAAVSATFNAAPATSITRARIWRWYGQVDDASWRMLGSTLEGRPLDACAITMGGCNFGNPNYAPSNSDENDNTVADFTGLSTAGIRYRLACEAPSASPQCGNGASLYRAAISIFGSKMTINDPTAPALQTPSGALWTAGGYQRGPLTLVAPAADNTGISSTQLLVDDVATTQNTRSCNYSRPAPCTDEPGAQLTLNTTTLTDGPHPIAVRAFDAAGNPATMTRPSPALIDNNAPAAPQNLRTPDGATTRSTNSWSLAWDLAPDPGSPIIRARYSICPSGTPPPSSACTIGQRDATDIRELGPFALPGPGTWDVRVTLEDQTGLTDPARSSAIALTYRHSGDPGTMTPTPPRNPSTNPTPPASVKPMAALRLTRLRRTANVVTVTGTTRRLATGRVTVTVSQRIARRTLRITRSARLTRGRFALRLRLTGRLARARRATLTVRYRGSARVRSATLRRTLTRPR